MSISPSGTPMRGTVGITRIKGVAVETVVGLPGIGGTQPMIARVGIPGSSRVSGCARVGVGMMTMVGAKGACTLRGVTYARNQGMCRRSARQYVFQVARQLVRRLGRISSELKGCDGLDAVGSGSGVDLC
ncbi:hypothetical protein SARC_02864 [Sphaeroforma arctica JP610]|uniref:Uncharacterized protein n=1 Tax=Sphaeroforma arctica JP610 TaxID=667725 RepID=A0A0L0G7C5_9EUKA|nr:hypothetical protein SARC_02864 [Sphaeroforma arctica JP610]KNC84942.1 hypothetical protein SARC_02864 [Sphaeroforma arctica JP610]|eukprot:XP_014158844.1 hypothetical protein SARC_02864 [Sphaeroforma arctica JP610]